MLFWHLLIFLFKIKNFMTLIRMSISLDPDKIGRFYA